jgi:hypothetical protein
MSPRPTSTLRRHGSGISRRSSSSRPARPKRSETGHGCPKVISVAWMRFFSVARWRTRCNRKRASVGNEHSQRLGSRAPREHRNRQERRHNGGRQAIRTRRTHPLVAPAATRSAPQTGYPVSRRTLVSGSRFRDCPAESARRAAAGRGCPMSERQSCRGNRELVDLWRAVRPDGSGAQAALGSSQGCGPLWIALPGAQSSVADDEHGGRPRVTAADDLDDLVVAAPHSRCDVDPPCPFGCEPSDRESLSVDSHG